MKKEKSCGIIVFYQKEEPYILLIHHNLGHWGIPKGHMEIGETEEETALREVFEETNIKTTIMKPFREKITYSPKPNVIKDVVFFLGEAISTQIKIQQEEIKEARFLSIEDALEKITYEEEKKVVKKAIINYLKDDLKKET